MAKVVVITSNHNRHAWFVNQLSNSCELVTVICEEKPISNSKGFSSSKMISEYFEKRTSKEQFWFGRNTLDDHDFPINRISWGKSNSEQIYTLVKKASPDIIILFGSSIIKKPMLDYYKNKIINMHLGLSPYYRGSATNFWPLVDDCPECVGVTIHHATLRVDGGNILAQARPSVVESDDSHDLGCKSIIKGAELLSKIIQTEALPTGYKQEEMVGKLCRSKDFDEDMLMKLLYNFDGGMMFDYVNNKKYRDKKYPIVI